MAKAKTGYLYNNVTEDFREILLSRIQEKYTVADSGCWVWGGAKADLPQHPYAVIGIQGVNCRVHRVMYALKAGYLSDDLEIDHTCCNTLCVNPAHLEAVTRNENQRRVHQRRGRQSHCSRGHSLEDPASVYITRRREGWTEYRCKICNAIRGRETKRRRASA